MGPTAGKLVERCWIRTRRRRKVGPSCALELKQLARCPSRARRAVEHRLQARRECLTLKSVVSLALPPYDAVLKSLIP